VAVLKAEGNSGGSSQVVTVYEREEMKEHGRQEETMVVAVAAWWLRLWQTRGDRGGREAHERYWREGKDECCKQQADKRQE